MIIFLNGPSSSGKSSIAKALCKLFDNRPFIHTGIDKFFKMMPPEFVYFGKYAKEGFHFYKDKDEQGEVIKIENGPYGDKFYRNMIKSICMLGQDQDLIIDEVLFFQNDYMHEYIKQLRTQTVYFVGIFCDLKILQEREFLRGDRMINLARPQFYTVHHADLQYDLTLDTSVTSVFDNAQQIIDFVRNNPEPQGFKKTAENLKLFDEPKTSEEF